MTTRLFAAGLLLAAAWSAGCASDKGYTLTLRNETLQPLVPYPVVTAAGQPPQRQADPANTLAPGAEVSIDVDGFNPLYYSDVRQRALLIELALDEDPPALLARMLRYPAPPDAVGNDPALQPELVMESFFEPTKKAITLTVGSDEPPNDPFTFSEQ